MGKCTIKNNIRRLRFENGEMSQQELANKAGVTRQAIISVEKSNYFPSLELAFKISRAFHAGVEDVFTFEDGNTQEDVK